MELLFKSRGEKEREDDFNKCFHIERISFLPIELNDIYENHFCKIKYEVRALQGKK